LPSPATVSLVLQLAQPWVVVTCLTPMVVSAPLACGLCLDVRMSVHFSQAIVGTLIVAGAEAFRSLSAWRTLGDAAMPSAAYAAVAMVRVATVAAIAESRLIFIFVSFVSFIAGLAPDIGNTPAAV